MLEHPRDDVGLHDDEYDSRATPVAPLEEVSEEPVAAFRSGQVMGSYRILKQIGLGGMSYVYLAERTDLPDQKVALKILRLYSDGLKRRFEQEKRILARLDHPHIARFFDMGTTPEGCPWFALEYIDGESILKWCDRRKADINERLAMFLEVCGAVSFAHQNLVIHRDLKPMNIMVTRNGAPKLLDFGIAALINPETGDQHQATIQGGVLMTPAYASPEQWRGELLNASTDVYSLGVVLFQLLTGALPFSVETLTPLEACDMLTSRDAPHLAEGFTKLDAEKAQSAAANRRLATGKLRRLLKGDLRIIVAKALRREPKDRYPSVEALADDLRRYLGGMPIQARPPTLRYRLVKYTRRHRYLLGFGISVILMLSLSLGIVLREQRRAERERIRAEEALQASEEVTEYLTNLFEFADPAAHHGNEPSAREMLDLGRERLDGELVGRDFIRGRLFQVMGRVYQSMGADEQADQMLTEAARLFEAADRPAYLASAYADRAEVLGGLSDLAGMEEQAKLAVAVAERAEVPAAVRAEAYDAMGSMTLWRGQLDEALQWYQRALALRRTALTPDDPLLAYSHFNIGSVYHYQSRLVQAEPHFLEALNLSRGATGRAQAAALRYKEGYALLLRDRGRYPEALAIGREVVAKQKEIYGADHPVTLLSMSNLGMTADAADALFEASTLHREVLQQMENKYGKQSLRYGYAALNLARTLGIMGRFEQSEQYFREVISVMTRNHGAENRDSMIARVGLSRILTQAQRPDEAELLAQQALAYYGSPDTPDTIFTGSSYLIMAEVQMGLGDFDAAVRWSEKAAESYERHLGPNADFSLGMRALYGQTLLAHGEMAAAKQVLLDVIKRQPSDRLASGRLLQARDLAKLELKCGRAQAAVALIEPELVANRALAVDEPSPRLAFALTVQAQALLALGRSQDALATQREALTLVLRLVDEDAVLTIVPRARLAVMQAACGQAAAAEATLDKARAVAARISFAGAAYHFAVAEAAAKVAFYNRDLQLADQRLTALLAKKVERFGEQHLYLAEDECMLAQVKAQRGDAAGAEALFQTALARWAGVGEIADPQRGMVILFLADFYLNQGRRTEAAALETGLALVGDHVAAEAPPRVLADLCAARLQKAEHRGAGKVVSRIADDDVGYWAEEYRLRLARGATN